MFCISVNEWHRRAVSFTAHIHTEARAARGVFSICRLTKWGHKYMNNIPRTARRVTSWAFDRFIWVKRSSYHIYIGYRNLKGSHGNLSKYKFGLAEYIAVYVIQLQQLLQLLLRIITQYAKYLLLLILAFIFTPDTYISSKYRLSVYFICNNRYRHRPWKTHIGRPLIQSDA